MCETMRSQYKRECPVCYVGTIEILQWYYPADRINPVDCGLEIVGQKCECDIEAIMNALCEEVWLE